MPARARFHQGLTALRPTIPTDRDDLIARLPPPARAAFVTLPTYDQAHLCAVCRLLLTAGETDADLLFAALLHDIGKSAPTGRVRLPDRVLAVLLAHVSPRTLDRLARLPAPRWRRGLALAVHHPRLGAEQARQLGCSERACWLMAHHADDPPPADTDLLRLIAADHAC